MTSLTDMDDGVRTTADFIARICRLFEELDVTFSEFISISYESADGVYFKNYGDSAEDVSFFASRRALPEGLHKYLPVKIDRISSVIVLTTTAESGDFSSKWRNRLKRESSADPFVIGDPVRDMLNELANNGFFSIRGECFCSVGGDLRESYEKMTSAVSGVIEKAKRPRVRLLSFSGDTDVDGVMSVPACKSLIYRERAHRSGGHRYNRLKSDSLTFQTGDEK